MGRVVEPLLIRDSLLEPMIWLIVIVLNRNAQYNMGNPIGDFETRTNLPMFRLSRILQIIKTNGIYFW